MAFLYGSRPAQRLGLQQNRGGLTTYSNTYESPQEFLNGIYKTDQHLEVPQHHTIKGVVVPHHLAATESIASGIKILTQKKPTRILLLSPDHFHRCPNLICTTKGIYQTHFGKVSSSVNGVEQILQIPEVSEEPALFKKEHGIYAVVPYIAHYLPQTEIITAVISQRLPWTKEQQTGLLNHIIEMLDDHTVLVISSDFSHYLPLEKSDEMDEATAQTIFSKDLDGVLKLKNPDQNDCPRCLWLLGSVADKLGFYNPSVLLHTNSARLLGDKSVKETTSHFAIVWYANDQLAMSDITFAGDVTLTRAPNTEVPSLSKAFKEFWQGNGIRVVNLEGPLARTCRSNLNSYIFCNRLNFWSKIRDVATHWGVENNHMLDQGKQGYEETKAILQSEGESIVTTSPYQDSQYFLIALTAVMNSVPEKNAINLKDAYERVIQNLNDADNDKLKVIYAHSGVEYKALADDQERRFLQSFIDTGADAVIVAHSHVPGGMYVYKDKPIFFGLGNFIFDQQQSAATKTAKVVRLRKDKEAIHFQTLVSQ